MHSHILIPDTNPIKFVEKDLTDTDCIHLFDKYNYENTVQEFEGLLPYTQKWVKKDPIRLQVWLSGVDYCNIDLVDCKGVVIQNYPINITLPQFLINDVIYNIVQFNIDTTSLATGKYFFVLNYQKAFTPTVYHRISEPQEILNELKPSILVRYYNSYNEFNTIFKTSFNTYFEQDFYIRIEGRVKHDKHSSNRQTYDDQRLNLTLLSAKPFEIFRFYFGSGNGVPAWVGAKLNMIIGCNKVYVDGKEFTFIDELNKKEAGYYTRFLYEIQARYSIVNYVQRNNVPDPPSITGVFNLPDAVVGVPYNYIQNITGGDQPFYLGAITKPAWMNITLNGTMISFTGTPAVGNIGTNITVSFFIGNTAGGLTLTDTIDVIAAAACIPVSFTGTPVLPDAIYGQAYLASIPIAGTFPYILSNIIKPSWATITSNANGIDITGTPTLPGIVTFSFDISNCGGGAGSTISFNQNITITSGVIITGNTGFSAGIPSGSGSIIAPPGTLVTVRISAGGNPVINFTLSTSITTPGVSITGSTSITNGVGTYTFIMPNTGNVSWNGVFTSSPASSAGGGSISVS
jgi:hypothetical protein